MDLLNGKREDSNGVWKKMRSLIDVKFSREAHVVGCIGKFYMVNRKGGDVGGRGYVVRGGGVGILVVDVFMRGLFGILSLPWRQRKTRTVRSVAIKRWKGKRSHEKVVYKAPEADTPFSPSFWRYSISSFDSAHRATSSVLSWVRKRFTLA
ncbi:hypothetical protein L1987_36262 [Smallanthus sonchifolius]|uniref:Uncharacterized protein n=1 Tax=Smallanthus sonchifolius TaxID=185202 RepID=A0ACB9HD34_9ASTR|nr:hypothetical protein L1987_36262 [Smallanthus sonchifolius]